MSRPTSGAFFLGDLAFLQDNKFRKLARRLPDPDEFNSAVGAYFIALAMSRRNGHPEIDAAAETDSRFIGELVAVGLLTDDGFPCKAWEEWRPQRPAEWSAPGGKARAEQAERDPKGRLLPKSPASSAASVDQRALDTQEPAQPARAGDVQRIQPNRTESNRGESRESESQVPTAVPARDRTRRPPVSGFTRAGDVDLRGPLLDQRQRDAWVSFGSEWDQVKDAWLARGLRYPPTGAQDEEGSQREILWQLVRDWPEHLPEWIAQAPKGASAMGVVGYVLERFHQARQESLDAAEARESAWFTTKAEDAATAPAVLADLQAKAS